MGAGEVLITDRASSSVVGAAAATDSSIVVSEVECRYGGVLALDRVSLTVAHGQFVSILGPSGCGKTTLLRVIAGLQRQDSGRILLGGLDVSSLPPHRRPVNLVFQRYALFPHLTVAENVGFALRLQRCKKPEIKRKVTEMLRLVGLPNFGERRVTQLSGGQAQRVALARALVTDPPVLLLDEPLAALDLKLRQAMQRELREIQQRVRSTFVYVTHDQNEAFVLSDHVVLMSEGQIVQQGAPADVYQNPQNEFAARFFGEANLFRGVCRDSEWGHVLDEDGVLVTTPTAAIGSTPTACVRPENIEVRRYDEQAIGSRANCLSGRLIAVTFLGSTTRLDVERNGGVISVELSAKRASSTPAIGDRVELVWKLEDVVVFDE